MILSYRFDLWGEIKGDLNENIIIEKTTTITMNGKKYNK